MPLLCFICNIIIPCGEGTRVSSSITPHSYVSYPEKIGELMGEEFVIIVTDADYMCMKCTSFLINLDKLGNEIKLAKNAMLTFIHDKYRILPADQPEHSSSAGGSNAPTKIRQYPSKIKENKCHICPFKSKDLGDFSNHMMSYHTKEKNNEQSKQTVKKTVTQEQKPQQKQHKTNHQLNIQTQQQQQQKKNDAYQEQTTEVTLEGTTSVFQPTNKLNSIENQQVVITNEDESIYNLINNKCTMDMYIDMLLKDNIPDEISEVSTQVTQDIPENMSGQTEILLVNQEIPDANVDIGDMAFGGSETGTDYTNIESMLTSIRNDINSPQINGLNAQHFYKN